MGCVHHDAVAERAHLWPALTVKIGPGNTDLEGEHSLAWFFGLPESGTVDVGDSSLPLHVRRQPSRPPILSRSLSPPVARAQVCRSHSTYARQTYGRRPKSTGGARSNKPRAFRDVCAPATDPRLRELRPHERLLMCNRCEYGQRRVGNDRFYAEIFTCKRKLRLRERFRCWASFRVVLTRKGIDAMYKAYKKRRKKRRGASDDETEASADEGRADPGTAEADQTASTAEGTLGRGTRRAATSTDYGGPVTRRRRADDGEAEQSRRARRGREQDVAEISRRMYEEIRSSRDPRDHVEDG